MGINRGRFCFLGCRFYLIFLRFYIISFLFGVLRIFKRLKVYVNILEYLCTYILEGRARKVLFRFLKEF